MNIFCAELHAFDVDRAADEPSYLVLVHRAMIPPPAARLTPR
jgi:hypothetical protein